MLHAFGVQTKCENPKYQVLLQVHERTNLSPLRSIWYSLSYLSLTAIPYYHPSNIQAQVTINESVTTENTYTDQRLLWLPLFPVTVWDVNRTIIQFNGVIWSGEANLGYFYAQEIRKAISAYELKSVK